MDPFLRAQGLRTRKALPKISFLLSNACTSTQRTRYLTALHFHFILKFFKEGNPSAKMLVFKGLSNEDTKTLLKKNFIDKI